jgi:hypothetical protein
MSKYPSVHGGGGHSFSHNVVQLEQPDKPRRPAPRYGSSKTLDFSLGVNRELSDRHWGSYSRADHSLPLFPYTNLFVGFWLNCLDLHRDFYREILRPQTPIRVATGNGAA